MTAKAGPITVISKVTRSALHTVTTVFATATELAEARLRQTFGTRVVHCDISVEETIQ